LEKVEDESGVKYIWVEHTPACDLGGKYNLGLPLLKSTNAANGTLGDESDVTSLRKFYSAQSFKLWSYVVFGRRIYPAIANISTSYKRYAGCS
jgi:hypothetical protein